MEFAALREAEDGPKRRFVALQRYRLESGVKPTCRDSWTDAFDQQETSDERDIRQRRRVRRFHS